MKDQLARNNGLVYNNHHRHLNKMLLVLVICECGIQYKAVPQYLIVLDITSVLLLEVKLRTMVPLGFAKPIQKFPRHQNHRMLSEKIVSNGQALTLP
jgi:hypothetical protein